MPFRENKRKNHIAGSHKRPLHFPKKTRLFHFPPFATCHKQTSKMTTTKKIKKKEKKNKKKKIKKKKKNELYSESYLVCLLRNILTQATAFLGQ